MRNQNQNGKRFNIIIAVFMAILLWFYVVNVENPTGETTLSNVPVTIQGEDALESQGLIITNLSRESMNLKVKGKRKSFLELYRGTVSVVLNVSEITRAGEYTITGEYRFVVRDTSAVRDLNVTERESFAVTVTVKNRDSKEINVLADFTGTLANGFEQDAISVAPSTVEIIGPEDVIEQISHGEVALSGDHLSESINEYFTYILYDAEGNVIEDDTLIYPTPEVLVTMPVVQVYELPLAVDLISGGGAYGNDVVYTITPETITVSGDESLLEEVIVLGEINLAEVFSYKSVTFDIPIPAGIKNRSGETEATVTLSIEGLEMKSMTARDIRVIGVPEGYRYTLVKDELQVWIRGEQAQLDLVTEDQIHVVVDLSGVTPVEGQQRAEATVTLTGAADVGVVGIDYSVAVILERS